MRKITRLVNCAECGKVLPARDCTHWARYTQATMRHAKLVGYDEYLKWNNKRIRIQLDKSWWANRLCRFLARRVKDLQKVIYMPYWAYEYIGYKLYGRKFNSFGKFYRLTDKICDKLQGLFWYILGLPFDYFQLIKPKNPYTQRYSYR